jgi:hypothetical protein
MARFLRHLPTSHNWSEALDEVLTIRELIFSRTVSAEQCQTWHLEAMLSQNAPLDIIRHFVHDDDAAASCTSPVPKLSVSSAQEMAIHMAQECFNSSVSASDPSLQRAAECLQVCL